jgi:ABC-2 type transport system ATP-binding protein
MEHGVVKKLKASPQAAGAQSAVLATGLRKSFGDHVVLDSIDLDVAEGTVYALLGPNGSGKTTTVQILSTVLHADAGTVRVAGHDLRTEPEQVRAAIGVTGQFSVVDNLLTGQENLILMADLHHLDRAEVRRRAGGVPGASGCSCPLRSPPFSTSSARSASASGRCSSNAMRGSC